MNDYFYEQLVPGKPLISTPLLILAYAACVAAAFFLTYLIGFFSMPIGLILLYLVYYFLKPMSRVEYSYEMVNESLDIARILNKEKRKDLLSLDLKTVRKVQYNVGHIPDPSSYTKLLDYRSAEPDGHTCGLFFSQNDTSCLLLIDPSEDMLNAMKHYLPRW